MNLIRLAMALPMLCVVTLILRGQLLPSDASSDSWLWLSISGLIGFVFGDMCLFRAFVLIGPRLSSLIMATTPLMTALISYMVLGEVLGSLALLGMFMTILGVGWALLDRRARLPMQPGHRARGIALALGGALGQAGGLVISKYGMGDYDAFAATQIRVIAAFVGWLGVFLVARHWAALVGAFRDRSALRSTAIGAFFGPVAGVGLSLVAVQRSNAGVAASIMSITPILLIPVSVLFLKERVGFGGVLGTLLAVGGVTVLFLQ